MFIHKSNLDKIQAAVMEIEKIGTHKAPEQIQCIKDTFKEVYGKNKKAVHWD